MAVLAGSRVTMPYAMTVMATGLTDDVFHAHAPRWARRCCMPSRGMLGERGRGRSRPRAVEGIARRSAPTRANWRPSGRNTCSCSTWWATRCCGCGSRGRSPDGRRRGARRARAWRSAARARSAAARTLELVRPRSARLSASRSRQLPARGAANWPASSRCTSGRTTDGWRRPSSRSAAGRSRPGCTCRPKCGARVTCACTWKAAATSPRGAAPVEIVARRRWRSARSPAPP